MQYKAKDKSRQLNRNTLWSYDVRFLYVSCCLKKKSILISHVDYIGFFFFFPKVRNVNLQNHRELRIVTLLLRIT